MLRKTFLHFIFIVPLLLFVAHHAGSIPGRDSGWDIEMAEEDFGDAVTPVFVIPSQIPKEQIIKGPVQAMPPRYPKELDKGAFRTKQSTAPIASASHFLHLDQSSTGGFTLLAPAKVKSFKGLEQTRFFPPDPVAAAGPKHVVLAVNSSIGIFTKKGKKLAEFGFGTFFRSLTEIQGASLFDPKILFDQFTGHFVLVVDALRDNDKRSWYILAVSKTDDPEGEWALYALDMGRNGKKKSHNWADFPGLGIDETAIYMTGNMFNFNTDEFEFAKLRIVKKDEVYQFGTVHFFDRWNLKDATGRKADTVQPAHSFGATQIEYLVSLDGFGGNKLTLWNVPHPGASRPALKKKGVNVSSYAFPPDAPQKGLAALINTGDAGIRNAAFLNGSIFAAHAVAGNFGSGEVSALRIYELREDATLVQEITFGDNKRFFYYPAIMPDSHGNLFIVFSSSSSTEFAGIRYTGRKASQAPGEIQNSKVLKTGDSSYFTPDGINRNRWGDYNGIGLDPTDDSVWIFSEIPESTARWVTHVGRVKFK